MAITTDYIGNTIPAPSLGILNASTTDQELKYSAHNFTQKGGTLKPGQGVLLIGTVVARDTVSNQWVKYASGGSNGAGTPLGVLRKTVDTGSSASDKAYQGNIVLAGILKYNLISSANTTNLASAVTALNARTDTTLGIFSF